MWALMLVSAMVMPLFSQPVLAQATTGTIRGVVSDQTGAVVPGAKIVAKNQATGVETAENTSTGDGVYRISNLTPGVYTVTVEAANFKRSVITEINVRVGEDATIDVNLQPGGVTETVTVTAGSEETIQKETSQISSSFEARKVAELPSNAAGSGIDTLALLAPGVVPGFGNVNSNGVVLSVNGNRSRSNNFTIDGQDNNDLSIGGPSFFVGNQDQVQDFQVVTNNFSAQYGRNQGAIVNIVTKTGTNEFHGTAFFFYRDQKNFDTLTNIQRRSGDENPPPLQTKVFGGTVGGPIIKDKAFFFGSFQGIRQPQNAILRGNLGILPEEFARLKAAFPGNDLITAIADFGPFAIPLGNPQLRTDVENALDTVNIGGQIFDAGLVQRQVSVPFSQDEFSLRGDVKLTSKDDVWARYLYQDSVSKNNLVGANGFTGDVPARSQNLGSSWTRQISSRAVNEFRFAYSRLFVKFGGGCEGPTCILDPTEIGNAFTFLNLGGVRGASGFALQNIGPATNLPQGRIVESFQFTDNYSLTRGRHQFIMGADIRRLDNSVPFLPNVNGAFTVGSNARAALNTPQQVVLAAGQDTINYKETDQFYFFQDDFKFRDNLTLNLGVRYEYIGQPINTLHDLTLERESNPDTAIWRQSIPLEGRIFGKLPADKNNWAPRLGFAYSPRIWKGIFGEDATVIRGGYSMAFDPPFYNIMLNVSTASPLVFNNSTLNPAAGPAIFPVPDGVPTGDKVRAFAEAAGLIAVNTFDPRFFNQTKVSQDFYNPYVQQWSLGIQRQIDRNNVAEVRYVGNKATGLFQSVNRNPRFDNLFNGFTLAGINFPSFRNLLPSGIAPLSCVNNPATPDNEAACNGRLLNSSLVRSRENTANSNYHGLQTRYNGRLLNQFTLGASYTLSKTIDNASEIFAFGENAFAQFPFNITGAERGLSGFDRRHAFSFNGIWDIPVYKDQQGVIGRILGGWQLNSTYVIASGRRFTPSQGFLNLAIGGGYFDAAFDNAFAGETARPFIGNINAPRGTVAISQIDAAILGAGFFGVPVPLNDAGGFYSLNDLNNGIVRAIGRNDARYVVNMPGAATIFGSPFGDAPRNSEQGPTLNQVNGSVFKNTRIAERFTIQFRAEFFNLFNHPNPGYGVNVGGSLPSTFVDNAGFAGAAFNDFTDIELGNRVVQFGLRLIF
jgi:outer membrane receptor protein involved in Fe transport